MAGFVTTDSRTTTDAIEPADRHFYEFDVSSVYGKDSANALNDVVRMLSIHVTVQALAFFNDAACPAFFTAEFVLMSLYVVLGVLVYWLILRRIVVWK